MSNIKDKKIAVLMGGNSSEREISLKSGKAVLKALKSKGFNAVAIDCGDGPDIIDKIKDSKADCAYIILHGGYGENGSIQGLLDVMNIPFTGPGVRPCAVAMDKVMTKQVLMSCKISTAQFVVIDKDTIGDASKVSLPVIVKPPTQGSTIGITVVTEQSQMENAINEAFKFDEKVLIESFIEGREVTCAVLDGETLPLVEIKPKEGIYDFDSKYSKEKTEFLVPAPLDDDLKNKIETLALASFEALGCKAIARIDFMVDGNNNPYVLEVNTVPGMTEMSLVPMAAKEAGISYEDLTDKIVEMAFNGNV